MMKQDNVKVHFSYERLQLSLYTSILLCLNITDTAGQKTDIRFQWRLCSTKCFVHLRPEFHKNFSVLGSSGCDEWATLSRIFDMAPCFVSKFSSLIWGNPQRVMRQNYAKLKLSNGRVYRG